MGKVFGAHMDMGVEYSAVAHLVDFDDHLPQAILVDVAVSVQAYIVVYCCYHAVMFCAASGSFEETNMNNMNNFVYKRRY